MAVPVFKNRTHEPAVESTITSGRGQRLHRGRLRVVPLDEADAVLEGEVTGYSLEAIAFDRTAVVRAYRLRVTLNVQFRDLRRSTMLWQQEGLQETSDFQVAGSVSDTVAREEGAVGRPRSRSGARSSTSRWTAFSGRPAVTVDYAGFSEPRRRDRWRRSCCCTDPSRSFSTTRWRA